MRVKRKRRSQRGGILVIVLFIMMAVAFLSAQGLRLMMITQRSQDQRLHTAQLHQLLELGQMRLARQPAEETFTVAVSVKSNLPDRIGSVTIEKSEKSAKDENGWRITVRYPYNEPSEQTAIWEGPK